MRPKRRLVAACGEATRKTATRRAALYGLFAILATGVNVGAQRLVLSVATEDWGLYVAMAVGTIAGLSLKFVLDARFVFVSFRPMYIGIQPHVAAVAAKTGRRSSIVSHSAAQSDRAGIVPTMSA